MYVKVFIFQPETTVSPNLTWGDQVQLLLFTARFVGRHPYKASSEIYNTIQVCKEVMVLSFPKPYFHCQMPTPPFFSQNSESSHWGPRQIHFFPSFCWWRSRGFYPRINVDIPFFSKSLKKSILRGTYIFDCINGIICLGDETNGYILWNPAIREYKVLLKLSFHICHPFNTFPGNTFTFGYGQNSNDYKVVQIVTYSRDNILHPVHIYNLRTDSWRQVNTAFDPSIIHFPLYFSNEIYLNGVHH